MTYKRTVLVLGNIALSTRSCKVATQASSHSQGELHTSQVMTTLKTQLLVQTTRNHYKFKTNIFF